MLHGSSKESLNRSVRTTSKESRLERTPKDSVKTSKTEREDVSRETAATSKQLSQPENSDSDVQVRPKDSRSKTRESSSQQVTIFESPRPETQSETQTSEAVVSRGMVSRDVATSEFASRGMVSRDFVTSELVNSETLPLESQQSKSVYEDILFTSEEMPKAQTRETYDPDTGEEVTAATSQVSADTKVCISLSSMKVKAVSCM